MSFASKVAMPERRATSVPDDLVRPNTKSARYDKAAQPMTYDQTMLRRSRGPRILTTNRKHSRIVLEYEFRMKLAEPPSEMPNGTVRQAHPAIAITIRAGFSC